MEFISNTDFKILIQIEWLALFWSVLMLILSWFRNIYMDLLFLMTSIIQLASPLQSSSQISLKSNIKWITSCPLIFLLLWTESFLQRILCISILYKVLFLSKKINFFSFCKVIFFTRISQIFCNETLRSSNKSFFFV